MAISAEGAAGHTAHRTSLVADLGLFNSLSDRPLGEHGHGRPQFGSKTELMLSLVGYAVGLGNVWRFPYLCYTYGGGAFLIAYICALVLLGLPLYVLELGLGQTLRKGCVGVWETVGLPRLRGVGYAATLCTFLVSLYYNVILTWTIYYLGRTIIGILCGGVLPWDDELPTFTCPDITLIVRQEVASSEHLFDEDTGVFNTNMTDNFWCPDAGLPTTSTLLPSGYERRRVSPARCPSAAAISFWNNVALRRSSGLDDMGSFHPDLLISYTIAWILVYACIFKGVSSSGKVVYFTATMPYLVLAIFFIRAITLPHALSGVRFYLQADFTLLGNAEVWLRATTQVFFSLGVGFGSLIAFGSYGSKRSDFARDALHVSLINFGTSLFCGFVVFLVLGFLAHELSQVDPCFRSNSFKHLSEVGLSGPGLAFIAFPIAMSQMPWGWLWALLFFLMLFCLGIDTEFAMLESVITVMADAGLEDRMPRYMLTLLTCATSYVLGLIFITQGGVYWFELFDYYTCCVAIFVVTLLECCGLMWYRPNTWIEFQRRAEEWTGRRLGLLAILSWKFICPVLLSLLVCLSFMNLDLMGAANSLPFPEGKGYYPEWSIYVGWLLGLSPVTCVGLFFLGGVRRDNDAADPEFIKGSCQDDNSPKNEESRLEGADCTTTKVRDLPPSNNLPEHGFHNLEEIEDCDCGAGRRRGGAEEDKGEILYPQDIDVGVRLPSETSRERVDAGSDRLGAETPTSFAKDVSPRGVDTTPDCDLAKPKLLGRPSSCGSHRSSAKLRSVKKGRRRCRSTSSARSARSARSAGDDDDDDVPIYGFLCGVYLRKGLTPNQSGT